MIKLAVGSYCMFSGLDGTGDMIALKGSTPDLAALGMDDRGRSDWNRLYGRDVFRPHGQGELLPCLSGLLEFGAIRRAGRGARVVQCRSCRC
ncbi:peptidase inhibitor family I36 protein [Streptomyces sp. NBC_01283]|uniref:peptidase inhibitor family I36 protein n=1 Tax=Streptomyces sp. NBC_01283 TaxID=2903812 RepID=UPI00352E1AD6|nr:peptidase inhibitor family I36 protein [Streptomyces sp. NBC_01283]